MLYSYLILSAGFISLLSDPSYFEPYKISISTGSHLKRVYVDSSNEAALRLMNTLRWTLQGEEDDGLISYRHAIESS